MHRPRIAVVGRSGQLADALVRADSAEAEVICGGRPEVDIADPKAIARFLGDAKPHLVVNAAAYTAVDKAESEPEEAVRINVDGVANLADACARAGLPLIHLSTDFVFDGTKGAPYAETDPLAPLNVYGVTKARGEAALRERLTAHVILRTSWVYGPHGSNFVKTMLRLGELRDEVGVVADQQGSPTSARDLADAILAITPRLLASDRLWGTYHLTGSGTATWHGLAAEIFAGAARRGAKVPRLKAITTADYPVPARRPRYSVLDNSKFVAAFGFALPDWHQSLDRTLDELLPAAAERHRA